MICPFRLVDEKNKGHRKMGNCCSHPWVSRGYHVGITWVSRGYHVGITWVSRGYHVGITIAMGGKIVIIVCLLKIATLGYFGLHWPVDSGISLGLLLSGLVDKRSPSRWFLRGSSWFLRDDGDDGLQTGHRKKKKTCLVVSYNAGPRISHHSSYVNLINLYIVTIVYIYIYKT